jgi:hypothetical protein
MNPRLFWKFEQLIESGIYWHEREKFKRNIRLSIFSPLTKHRVKELK